MPNKKFLVMVIMALSLCLIIPGPVIAGNTDLATITESGRSQDWTDATHGNKVPPDYSVVFPDDKVNIITITIPEENWKTMIDDMTAEFGEFGSSSGGAMQAGGGDGLAFTFDPVYVSANITFDGKEWTDVGIRWKGQSTLERTWKSGSYKISMRLDFDHYEDENPDISNQRFYGFNELDLKSAMADDSLIRDKVVPEIFQSGGVVAPETAFYRVYVDHGDGPVYFGLYTMIENVEDTVIKTQFSDDSGNLYKPEGNGATFAEGSFDTASFVKKTNKQEGDWSDVESLYTILNSDTRKTNPAQWRQELEGILDVDEFINWLAINTAIQNWDSYGVQCKNFYLYTDPADGKITWIPWDNNEALAGGNNRANPGQKTQPAQITKNQSTRFTASLITNKTGKSGTSTLLSAQNANSQRTQVIASLIKNVTGKTSFNASLWTHNLATQRTPVIPTRIESPNVVTGNSASWISQSSGSQEGPVTSSQVKNSTAKSRVVTTSLTQRFATRDTLVISPLVETQTDGTTTSTASLTQRFATRDTLGTSPLFKSQTAGTAASTGSFTQRFTTQSTLVTSSQVNTLVTDQGFNPSGQPPGAGGPGAPPLNMNQTRPDGAINATNAGGGQMGSPLSPGLTEIGDNWPLIRYLMDDPVYYQMYLDDLEQAVTTSFEPSKMETIYQRYHDLIEPYVTGQYGEQKGYTNLNSASSFTSSLDQLIQQVNSRYEAVMEFLTGERGSASSVGV